MMSWATDSCWYEVTRKILSPVRLTKHVHTDLSVLIFTNPCADGFEVVGFIEHDIAYMEKSMAATSICRFESISLELMHFISEPLFEIRYNW